MKPTIAECAADDCDTMILAERIACADHWRTLRGSMRVRLLAAQRLATRSTDPRIAQAALEDRDRLLETCRRVWRDADDDRIRELALHGKPELPDDPEISPESALSPALWLRR